jgi:hypothetical protein
MQHAIREVESGGEPNDGCNAIGDNGNACGPCQIWAPYFQEAAELCPYPNYDPEYDELTPFHPCCELEAAGYASLCAPCAPGDTQCCQDKWI